MPFSLSDSAAELAGLIDLFNGLFKDSLNTVLVKGTDEPVYLPADEQHPHHRIIFAHGFYASALHEIAHWCVAGEQRRLLPDYGYWYKPDGRTAQEQAEFERVEVTPQAYEWLLTVAAGRSFNFSADNIGGGFRPSDSFRQHVHNRIHSLLEKGLPDRLQALVTALCQQQGRAFPKAEEFCL